MSKSVNPNRGRIYEPTSRTHAHCGRGAAAEKALAHGIESKPDPNDAVEGDVEMAARVYQILGAEQAFCLTN